MIQRASFAVIAIFWLVMNGLLWRAEFGSGNNIAAAVPPSLVWEKILTAPDDSALGINLQGKKLGYLRIRPEIIDAAASSKIASASEPEGMVRRLDEYTLQLDGSIVAEAIARSIRFESEFAFNRSLAWDRFEATAQIRPNRWQLKANAADRQLWFQSTDGDSEWIHSFNFDDLRDPRQLARIVDSPLLLALIPQSLSAVSTTNPTNAPLSFGLNWTARYEWLRLGRNRVRIYRLETRLLDRHRVVVLVSRVGEILRIELPGELKLINEVLYAS